MKPLLYNVHPVAQPDEFSCWAATMAMVASGSLSDGSYYMPEQVIEWADQEGTGRFSGPVTWNDIKVAMSRWGIDELAPAGWMPDSWANLLRERGPLGIVIKPEGNTNGIYHAVLLRGIDGDGGLAGTEMIVNDPLRGEPRRIPFLSFTQEWDLGAAANAMIMVDPTFVPSAARSEPSQDEFTQLLDAAPANDLVDGPAPIHAEPVPGGIIAGDVADAVNAGVTLVRLVANSASVHVDRTRVARAVPKALRPEELAGWAGPRRVARRYRTPDSEWWELWRAEYDFTIGAQFLFNGRRRRAPGQYLDDILVFLEVSALPPDFTIVATAHFPETCHMFGTSTPVAGMPFTVDLQVNGFFSQVVSWSRTLSFNLFGDGSADIV